MVNYYHQKTFIILKTNVMTKWNVKILQIQTNYLERNYRYSIQLGVFKI